MWLHCTKNMVCYLDIFCSRRLTRPGDVVRVDPNELSFNRVETYKEIYGYSGRDRPPFRKPGGPEKKNESVGMATVRDP